MQPLILILNVIDNRELKYVRVVQTNNQMESDVNSEPKSDSENDQRRLAIPMDVADDDQAIELVTVWFSKDKVKIMTRSGTELDRNPLIWGEIMSGIGENIASCIMQVTGVTEQDSLKIIKASMDRTWR